MIWSADFLAYDEKAHIVEWLYKEYYTLVLFTNSIVLNWVF